MKVSFNSTHQAAQLMRSMGERRFSLPKMSSATKREWIRAVPPFAIRAALSALVYHQAPFPEEFREIAKLSFSSFVGFGVPKLVKRELEKIEIPLERALHHFINKRDLAYRAGSLVQYLCEDLHPDDNNWTMNLAYHNADLQVLSSILKLEIQKYETSIDSLHDMINGLERVHFEEVNDKLIQEAHGNINAFVGRFIHPRILLIDSRSIALQKQSGDTKEVDTVRELFVEANRRCVAIRDLLHSVSSCNYERVRFPEL